MEYFDEVSNEIEKDTKPSYVNYLYGFLFELAIAWGIGYVLGIGFWRTLLVVYLGVFGTCLSLKLFNQPERAKAIVNGYKTLL